MVPGQVRSNFYLPILRHPATPVCKKMPHFLRSVFGSPYICSQRHFALIFFVNCSIIFFGTNLSKHTMSLSLNCLHLFVYLRFFIMFYPLLPQDSHLLDGVKTVSRLHLESATNPFWVAVIYQPSTTHRDRPERNRTKIPKAGKSDCSGLCVGRFGRTIWT